MELYLQNWYKKFFDELRKTKELKIISPFVKEQLLRKVESQFDFSNFELITRFNLQDFAMNVSSLLGLKYALEKGAQIFGIKELHSKVYLFDERAAIVTSANLTNGGLISNFECGIFLTDSTVIKNLHDYFNQLRSIAKNSLTVLQCEEWINKINLVTFPERGIIALPDFGASQTQFDKSKNYYIKFFGDSNNRVGLDYSIRQEIEDGLCHYACCFPKKKKPRQVNDGDVIFLARMTENPNDYAIFGRAIALKFKDGRDLASKEELSERPWKEKWPVYLRVTNPIFIDGSMNDCVLLMNLISKFDYDSFPSTRRRFDDGEDDIVPTKSLMRKAYVKLTHNSAEWLENEFAQTISNIGQVDVGFLEDLPQTTTDIDKWK